MTTACALTPAVTLADHTAMAAALADFERRYPAYARTAVLDEMRARDYARLDALGQVYLDYTGGALYADSQLAWHRDLLAGAVFGNPHSANLPPGPGREPLLEQRLAISGGSTRLTPPRAFSASATCST